MTAAIRATEYRDLPALAKFLLRAYQFQPADHHAEPGLLEWKYLHARPRWKGSHSYLLERDGQIIAHCGVCPVTFHLPDATSVNGVTMLDWAADSSAPGAGVRLFRKLMEMAPASFIIGGAPATRQIVPRIGFRHIGEAPTYSAWLRPWREVRTRPLTPRSALRLLHGLTHRARNASQATADWDFTPVQQFEETILPVLNRTNCPWTFCQRAVSDLNHLLKCPHLKMQGFLLRREGQLGGYFVIGRAGWESRLLDLVVNSSDGSDWNFACAAVTKAAKLDPEAGRIRVLGSFPILRQALEWNGYWCQYREPIMIHDPSNVLNRAFPVCFQLCDGDSGY